jgi:hypothetical protein
MQYALINSSKLSDPDCSFIAAVVNLQAQQLADAWGLPRAPVAFYATPEGLPVVSGEVRVVHIVDNLDDEGALGWHTVIGGLVISKVQAQDVNGTCCTVGHEVFETHVDPGCDQWRKKGAGMVALEVADPVEADAYPVTVTIMGETRTLLGSNWITPKWFDAADFDPDAERDHMGRVREPFGMTPGGYMVIADAAGNETDIYARRVRHADQRGELAAGRKLARPDSRLIQRLQATT